jgi:hypothetical protein
MSYSSQHKIESKIETKMETNSESETETTEINKKIELLSAETLQLFADIYKDVLELEKTHAKRYHGKRRYNNNGWRHQHKPRKPIFEVSAIELSDETKNININLNKMSTTNIDEISKIIKNIASSTADENKENLLKTIVEGVFQRAIKQFFISRGYATICFDLVELNDDLVNEEIQKKCVSYLEILDKNQECNEEQKVPEKNMKGYSQFLAELYNLNLISTELIDKFNNVIINNIKHELDKDSNEKPDREFMEKNALCLKSLVTNVENKSLYKKYIDSLNGIKSGVKGKIRFELMDIIDLIK